MKFFIFSFIVFCANSFAQEIKNPDQNVYGFLESDGKTYFVLQEGYLLLKNNDDYIEYYHKIYNDSTITNPNTEIKSEYSVNFIPYLLPSQNDNKINFDKPKNLGVLIQLNKSNEYILTNYGANLVDSLISKK